MQVLDYEETLEKPIVTAEAENDIEVPDNSKSTKSNNRKEEYSSLVEQFFANTFAPELMTWSGRLVVIIIWTILCCTSVYGAVNMEMDLHLEYFIPNGSSVDTFFQLDL